MTEHYGGIDPDLDILKACKNEIAIFEVVNEHWFRDIIWRLRDDGHWEQFNFGGTVDGLNLEGILDNMLACGATDALRNA